MDVIRLSPRLDTVARLAQGGKSITDVGTDHGYIPVYLAQTDARAAITACDVRSGPLSAARRSAEEYGVADRIRFVLADGLCFERACEADTVIIAGMGGETVSHILGAAEWTKNARVILQPQTKIDELCVWLSGHGYGIDAARLCEDSGRLYAVMSVSGGSAEEIYVESALLRSRDPLLSEWIGRRAGVCRRALTGMASSVGHDADCARQRALLARLEGLLEECEYAKGK